MTLTIDLPDEVAERARTEAEARGMTVEAFLVYAVLLAVERIERGQEQDTEAAEAAAPSAEPAGDGRA